MRILNTLKKVTAPLRYAVARRRLRNRDVSIIANNCWGGFMYRYMKIPFNSPFVGLFIMAPDYLDLLEHPEMLRRELHFIDRGASRYPDTVKAQTAAYPIATLGEGGPEIHFLHFPDAETARDKWMRRMRRVDFDNAIIYFHDGDGFTPDMLPRFDALPYREKVFFSARRWPGSPAAVYLPEFAGEPRVGRLWKFSDLHWNFAAAANRLMER